MNDKQPALLTPRVLNAAAVADATMPRARIAREYASCVTGIDADQLSIYRMHEGQIVFQFKNAADYEYAKGYAELTQLGAPTEQVPRGGKEWDLGDTRRVVIWRASAALFLIALVDDRPEAKKEPK